MWDYLVILIIYSFRRIGITVIVNAREFDK